MDILKDKRSGDAVTLLGVVVEQNGGRTLLELESGESTVAWEVVNSATTHTPTEQITQHTVSRLLSAVVRKLRQEH